LRNNPFRILWERLRDSLRSSFQDRSILRTFELDQELAETLQELAEQEQRPPGEVAGDLLSFALAQQRASSELVRRWRSLSPREQQVGALICLNLTNRQIASRLTISTETVKSHVRNVLRKFDVHSKVELSVLLSEWDFSAWDKRLR